MQNNNKISYIFFILIFISFIFAENVKKSDGLDVSVTWDKLRYYLMFAYSAYCSVGLKDWTCYWCTNQSNVHAVVTDIIYDEHLNAFAYVAYSSNTSERTQVTSIKNWIEDISSGARIDYPGVPGAKVALGFYETYDLIKGEIITAYKKVAQQFPNYKVIVTGHSLGAALSGFGGLDIAKLDPSRKIEVWNFGDPRDGNSVWEQFYKSKIPNTVRTVNQRDIVPHLPAQLLGFHHVPTEVWFEKNDFDFEICNGSGEDPNCSDSVSPFDYSIDDHLTYLGYDERNGHAHGCGSSS